MGYGWWIVCDGARMLINLKEAADIGRKIRVYGLSVREAFEEIVPPEEWSKRWKPAA